ncbi:hypothetical protein GCM10025786_07220 [Nocardioides caeni]
MEIVDAGQAATSLATLQRAAVDGDLGAAEELGADTEAAALLGDIVANAVDLGLSDVTFTYVTETGETSGDDGWTALVAVTWRIDGFDEASARTELPVHFADGGRSIEALGDDSARLPVWLSDRVGSRRSPDALVFGVASDKELAIYDRQIRRAITEIRGVIGGDERVVVEVPADTGSLDRALDVASGTYASIAAVTAPVDGSRTEQSPVHVFVNPAVYDAMDPVAAQVVATHEVVHAVTGAVLAQTAPLWLVEGFADYVALRDLDLPISRTAGQLIDAVEADGVPDSLPADSEFDPASGHLGVVYEAAWQVVVTLAEQGGETAVVEFYRAVLGGADVATELVDRFGWTEADLTAGWQLRVAGLG